MVRSRFNVVIPVSEGEGGGPAKVLLYNTLSDSASLTDRGTLAVLRGIEDGGPVPLDLAQPVAQLLEEGFLKKSIEEEERELEAWFRARREDESRVDLVVLTSYGCNLACPYCFEGSVKRPLNMTPETVEGVVRWTTGLLDVARPRDLRVVFFGGEPLLNPGGLTRLARGFHEACRARGVTQEIAIITNGVLLTPEIVDDLLPFGLKSMKITIDGDREAHDRKRPAKDGRSSFDRIIENLLRIRGKPVEINLGGNFDEENRSTIPALLDRLTALGLQDRIARTSFRPILKDVEALSGASRPTSGAAEELCTAHSFSETDLGWVERIADEVRSRGYAGSRMVSMGPCEFYEKHSYVVDAVGRLYKCPGFIGREGFEIGDVFHGFWSERKATFDDCQPWRNCVRCPWVPMCGGACVAIGCSKSGVLGEVNCEMPYLTRVSRRFLKDDLLRDIEPDRIASKRAVSERDPAGEPGTGPRVELPVFSALSAHGDGACVCRRQTLLPNVEHWRMHEGGGEFP